MTTKQLKFANAIIEGHNIKQASEIAGLAYKTGLKIRHKEDVAQYIKDGQKQALEAGVATASEVLRYLTEVMRNTKEHTKYRMQAAEKLGKYHSLFVDRVEIEDKEITFIVEGLEVDEC